MIVANGDDAFACLATAQPDAVAIDMTVLGRVGWQLVRVLRSSGKWSRSVIVAMIDQSLTCDDGDAQTARCDLLVVKPVEVDELVDLIRGSLATRRSVLRDEPEVA